MFLLVRLFVGKIECFTNNSYRAQTTNRQTLLDRTRNFRAGSFEKITRGSSGLYDVPRPHISKRLRINHTR